MDTDPISRDLETVLEYGGHEAVWEVPPNATITPGTGPNPWHGLTISSWSE